jgi:hypothetical protein
MVEKRQKIAKSSEAKKEKTKQLVRPKRSDTGYLISN